MGNVIFLNEHKRQHTENVDDFVAEFGQWLTAQRGSVDTHQLAAATELARYAHRVSLRGRDWLEMLPDEVIQACLLPARPGHDITPAALSDAERMALIFLQFLLTTQRIRPAEARFLEGWIRSTMSLFTERAEERAFLSADTEKRTAPSPSPRTR